MGRSSPKLKIHRPRNIEALRSHTVWILARIKSSSRSHENTREAPRAVGMQWAAEAVIDTQVLVNRRIVEDQFSSPPAIIGSTSYPMARYPLSRFSYIRPSIGTCASK